MCGSSTATQPWNCYNYLQLSTTYSCCATMQFWKCHNHPESSATVLQQLDSLGAVTLLFICNVTTTSLHLHLPSSSHQQGLPIIGPVEHSGSQVKTLSTSLGQSIWCYTQPPDEMFPLAVVPNDRFHANSGHTCILLLLCGTTSLPVIS